MPLNVGRYPHLDPGGLGIFEGFFNIAGYFFTIRFIALKKNRSDLFRENFFIRDVSSDKN